MKSFRSLIFYLTLSFLLVACGQASETTTQQTPQDAAYTAAAQTLDAELSLALTQGAQQTLEAENEALNQMVETQAAQLTEQATQTPVQGEEPGEATATLLATLVSDPQITVTTATQCRRGPNTSASSLEELTPGQELTPLGRSPDNEWWAVSAPSFPEQQCWVQWDDNIELQGIVFELPTVAPPAPPTNTPWPTPEGGIALSFSHKGTCGGAEYAFFEVTNLNQFAFESMSIRVRDITDDYSIASSDSNNPFLSNGKGCAGGNSTLPPNANAFIAVPFNKAKQDNRVRAVIQLCTGNGLNGTCVSTGIIFKP